MFRLRSATGAQAAVVLAAATTGALIAVSGSSSAGTSSLRYTTTPAALTTVTDRINATGTAAAEATVDLAFGATNQPVTSVDVRVGQHVHKGDLLATVDATSADAAVAAAQAAVTAAAAAASATAAASITPTAAPAPTSSPASAPRSGGSGQQPAGATTVCRTTTVTTSPVPAPGGSSATPTPAPSRSPRPARSGSPSASGAPSPSASQSPAPTGSASAATLRGAAARPSARPSAPGGVTVRTTRTCTQTTRATGTSSATTGGTARTGGGSGGGSVGSLTAAQQQLASAQAALAATKIIAPQDGVVSALDLTVGTLPGTPAVELRTTTFSVQVPVAEQDAPYVEAGQQVQLSYTALAVTGTGTVVAAPLEPSGTAASASGAAGRIGIGGTTSSVVTYPVTVAISDPPPGLLPGMSVQASWIAATRQGVLAVPTAAIQGGDTGYVVRVLSGGRAQTRPVSLGLSTTSMTEVTEGLAAGAAVVTGVR